MRKGGGGRVIFSEPTFAFDWLSSRQVMILERADNLEKRFIKELVTKIPTFFSTS